MSTLASQGKFTGPQSKRNQLKSQVLICQSHYLKNRRMESKILSSTSKKAPQKVDTRKKNEFFSLLRLRIVLFEY